MADMMAGSSVDLMVVKMDEKWVLNLAGLLGILTVEQMVARMADKLEY